MRRTHQTSAAPAARPEKCSPLHLARRPTVAWLRGLEARRRVGVAARRRSPPRWRRPPAERSAVGFATDLLLASRAGLANSSPHAHHRDMAVRDARPPDRCGGRVLLRDEYRGRGSSRRLPPGTRPLTGYPANGPGHL